MEKKLSELLKLVISDCHLVRYKKKLQNSTQFFNKYSSRKFYHDDSIMTASQAFILCDQLAGLGAIDFRYFNSFVRIHHKSFFSIFSFCFKQDGPIIAPILLNGSEIDVIDITPFLCYKSKQ